jgi:E3 ubiquitin-protein ligase makorin
VSRVDAWASPSFSALERFQERDIIGSNSTFSDPSEAPICSLAAAGTCTRGESCPYIHGDLCATCGKHCLHPHRPEEREEHSRQCVRNQKRLEALRSSQEIECCICLDRVLSKPSASERKFGLLAGCDHPFCISCIRGWRSSCQPQGTGPEIVVRTCPVCRAHSHYVIPSVIWYFSPEEKQEIVDGYKAKLRYTSKLLALKFFVLCISFIKQLDISICLVCL